MIDVGNFSVHICLSNLQHIEKYRVLNNQNTYIMRFLLLLFLTVTYINVSHSMNCDRQLETSQFEIMLSFELGDRIVSWMQFLEKSPVRGYLKSSDPYELFQHICGNWGFSIINYVQSFSNIEYNAMLERSKKCDKYTENYLRFIQQCYYVVLLDTKQTVSNYLQCEFKEHESFWLGLSAKYECGTKSIDVDLWKCLCKKENMNSNMVNNLVFNFNEYWNAASIATQSKFPLNIFSDLWDCDRSSKSFMIFEKNDISTFLNQNFSKNLKNILQYFPQCKNEDAYLIWSCTCDWGTSLLRKRYENPKE